MSLICVKNDFITAKKAPSLKHCQNYKKLLQWQKNVHKLYILMATLLIRSLNVINFSNITKYFSLS